MRVYRHLAVYENDRSRETTSRNEMFTSCAFFTRLCKFFLRRFGLINHFTTKVSRLFPFLSNFDYFRGKKQWKQSR